MEDTIILLDVDGIKQPFASITTFITDDCQFYAAFLPLSPERPETDSLVIEFRKYRIIDGKAYFYRLKTPEEAMRVIRAYKEHLDKVDCSDVYIDENEDEGDTGKCGKILKLLKRSPD